MGLRINTNVPSIRALRNLRLNDSQLGQSLERLSTGLRINRAGDDPSGLVISEQLRTQIKALEQGVENTQNASNLVSTADAALAEVQTILTGIKESIVFAQNTGGSSPEQIAAEQDAVDNAISAIDRIASTTRFADRALLNGAAEFSTSTTVSAEIQNLQIRSVEFDSSQDTRTFNMTVDTIAERGEVILANADSVGSTTVRITGALGTEDISLASTAGAAGVTSAINAVAGFTGIYAEQNGANVEMRTGDFGEEELIQVEVITGSLTGLGAAGTKTSDRGVDAELSFAGQQFTGNGNDFNVLTRIANLEFSLQSGTGAGTGLSLSVRNSGLTFQLNDQPALTDRLAVGINSINTAELGREEFIDRIKSASAGQTVNTGGFLNSLLTGGTNDLTANAENASYIVDVAIDQVSTLRGYLGAIQAGSLEPNVRSVNVEIENLNASLSTLRDLDFASETAEFTKAQILFQSSNLVLAQSNAIPQTILGLLGG